MTIKRKYEGYGRSGPLAGLGVLLASLAACGGAPQDPVVADFGIAYVKRPVVTEVDNDTGQTVLVDTDLRTQLTFNEGGDVYFRERASAAAPETNITDCLTGGLGDVRDLESSYEGDKLIFSLRLPDPDPNDDVEPTWNIYEYDVAAGGCPTRLISSDIIAESGDDIAPHYLPDGRIVFSSTRQRQTGAVLLDESKPQFPGLEENQREPAFVLHVMNASGGDIQQISFNQSHDLDPDVLMNGEIVFSRWDHMGSRNAINLYTVRPDGTELRALYGVHDHAVGTDGSTVQFVSPRPLPDGRILAMLKPFTGSAGGGAPVIIDAENYADANQPTWPNQGILSGSGQVSAVSLDVRTDGSISPAGRFRSVYPLWDGSNRALVSWSQCRLQQTAADGTITNTPCPATIPADAVEAFPVYGIYVYDLGNNTALPVVVPEDGKIIEEPVVLAPRDKPEILIDKAAGFELDSDYVDEGVGVLHIRSVYDFDGSFNALGATGVISLVDMANPTLTTPDQRPARFLRIVKAVPIPDDTVYDFSNTAFGRSRQQKMREIIGYAPVEPDGSVLVKVPGNVPLAISVVDKDGKRIGGRHQNWIQVRPGETLECNGCHVHNPTGNPAPLPLPHGEKDAPPSINAGAPTGPYVFPGTDPAKEAEMGETMAETRIRVACGTGKTSVLCPDLSPSVNLMFDDVWTDPAATPAASVYLRYQDLTTDAPTTASCLTSWDARCRIVINYETHIHPLWSLPRPDPGNPDPANTDWTCTNCHSTKDAMSMTQVPAGQLDLGDGPSTDEPDQFTSYRELLFSDNNLILDNGALVEETVQATDGQGNLLFETDPDTGEQILDNMGNPIPIMVPVRAPGPSMSVNGARSSYFLGKVDGSDAGHPYSLSAAELRLISEWLDIGAQYYNNPFDAPEN
jgi:hypothetical protein